MHFFTILIFHFSAQRNPRSTEQLKRLYESNPIVPSTRDYDEGPPRPSYWSNLRKCHQIVFKLILKNWTVFIFQQLIKDQDQMKIIAKRKLFQRPILKANIKKQICQVTGRVLKKKRLWIRLRMILNIFILLGKPVKRKNNIIKLLSTPVRA